MKMRKKKKMTTKRKKRLGYATIVEERGIWVEIAEINRMAMKRKARKQRKQFTEMKMN